MGVVNIKLNQEQLHALAYQDFLEKLYPLLRDYKSGGYQWNFGYSYVDCLNRSVHSGVWTYPWFTSFHNFNTEEQKITLIFAGRDKNYRSTELSFITESEVATAQAVLKQIIEFAQRASEMTGYQIEIQKPIWLADEYSHLLKH